MNMIYSTKSIETYHKVAFSKIVMALLMWSNHGLLFPITIQLWGKYSIVCLTVITAGEFSCSLCFLALYNRSLVSSIKLIDYLQIVSLSSICFVKLTCLKLQPFLFVTSFLFFGLYVMQQGIMCCTTSKCDVFSTMFCMHYRCIPAPALSLSVHLTFQCNFKMCPTVRSHCDQLQWCIELLLAVWKWWYIALSLAIWAFRFDSVGHENHGLDGEMLVWWRCFTKT